MKTVKGILRKKWFWVVLVLLVIGAAVVWWKWPKHYDLTVSYETTRLLGPLNADGTVNYVAALNEMYGQGVTPENNAAVLLIQAFGPEIIGQSVRTRTFELLGMDPPPAEGDYFVSWDDYAEAKLSPAEKEARALAEEMAARRERARGGLRLGAEDPLEEEPALWEKLDARREKAMGAPWAAKDDPLLADWAESVSGPLDIITAASKRPRYHIPLVSRAHPPQTWDVLVPRIGAFRSAARALAVRAMLRANEGKCDQAVADLLTVLRLARLVAQGPTEIERLVGWSIEDIACEAGAALAVSGKLSADEAKAFLAQLEDLPPLSGIAECADRVGRFSRLDMVMAFVRGRPVDSSDVSEVTDDTANIDWNEMCRKLNYWSDSLVAALRTEPYSARTAALEEHEAAADAVIAAIEIPKRPAWLRKVLGPGPSALEKNPVDVVVAILMPGGDRSHILYAWDVMRFRLLKVAVALAAFKANTGAYPDGLAELDGRYLTTLPEDLFAEGPLTYRRTDKGYLLYSLGSNARDDDGVHDPGNADIVICAGEKRRVPPDPYARTPTSRPGDGRRPGPGR